MAQINRLIASEALLKLLKALTDLYHLAIFYPQKQTFFSLFSPTAFSVYYCYIALSPFSALAKNALKWRM